MPDNLELGDPQLDVPSDGDRATTDDHRTNVCDAPSIRIDIPGEPLVSARAAMEVRDGVADPEDLPDVDISLVTDCAHASLPAFFDSLLRQRYPLDKIAILITRISDEVEDRRVISQFVDRHGGRFRAVRIADRRARSEGAGHNRNFRVASTAPYFVVSSVEVEYFDDTLTRLVRFMDRAVPDCAVVEARQFPFEHPKFYNPVSFETSWVSCCLALFRRSAFAETGGFENALGMPGMDAEMSQRLRRRGYRLGYNPYASVFHDFFGTSAHAASSAREFEAQLLMSLSSHPRNMGAYLWGECRADLRRYAQDQGARRSVPGLGRLFYRGVRRHFLARRQGKKPASSPLNRPQDEWRRPYSVREEDLAAIARDRRSAARHITASILMRVVPNHRDAFEFAFKTALLQTYPGAEVIVLEDGSTQLQSYVKSYIEDGFNVRYIGVDRVGRSRSCNLLMSAARGTHFIFLDDDDYLFLDHLETTIDEGMARGTEFAASWACAIYSDKTSEGISDFRYELPNWYEFSFSNFGMSETNYFPIQSIVFSHQQALSVGRVNEALDCLEDWNFFAKLTAGRSGRIVKRTTSCFRLPNSPTGKAERADRHRAAYGAARADILAFTERPRPAAPPASPPAAPVIRLLYHHIGDGGGAPYHVSLDRFAHHLDVIVNRLDKTIIARSGATAGDLPRIEIHFDDAYADIADAARLARARGFDVKIFATGYSLDEPHVFPADEYVAFLLGRRAETIAATRRAVIGLDLTGLPGDDAAVVDWRRYFADAWQHKPELAERILSEVRTAIGAPRPVRERLLSSGELTQLAAEGCVIGAHGLSHFRLADRPRDVVAREVTVIADRLAAALGSARPQHFAFPYGGADDIDAAAIEVAAEAGYSALYSCLGGDVEIGRRSVLGRFEVSNLPMIGFADALDACLTRLYIDGTLAGVARDHFCFETFGLLADTRW